MENELKLSFNTNAKKQKATIGVVVLCYNYKDYVKIALDSIYAQHEKFDEIIVVDDGSTDGSSDVLSLDKRDFLYIRQENGGVMSASIKGLYASKSDYIYFLDADDCITPSMVQEIKPLLLEDDLVKIQFQLMGIDQNGNRTGSVFPGLSSCYSSKHAISDNRIMGFYNSPPTSGNIYRAKFLKRLDLSIIDLREPIDGAVNLLAPYLGKLISVPKALGYYRVHNKNFSQVSIPTPERLRSDVKRLERRWTTAKQLSPLVDVPLSLKNSLFVLERTIMASVLENGSINLFDLYRLNLSSWKSGLHTRVKLFYIAWTISLLIPSKTLRRIMVLARKSATNRNILIRFIIKIFSGSY
ncbi:glycosyltransferase family A protein [Methylobacterium sp. HMF5984]|uniref:glycosyltransferase family A protein n=1 Tax=Methylobacterium sp. HMF5984 TaxID=3367370 RepID=UPI0038550BD3